MAKKIVIFAKKSPGYAGGLPEFVNAVNTGKTFN